MTNDRLERALSEAIEDLAGKRAPDYLNDILEQTSRTRQRPWWTFASRYTTMSPTFKFATVGAVALAIGIGISPLLQSALDGETNAPAADGPPQVAPPTPIQGIFRCDSDSYRTPFHQTRDGFEADDGSHAWRAVSAGAEVHQPVESNDERFAGISHETYGDYSYLALPDEGISPYTDVADVVVENDDGSWIGQWRSFQPAGFFDHADFDYPVGTVAFEGRGGFEGLTALIDMDYQHNGSWSECYYDFAGYILDGPLPSVGDAWSEREATAAVSGLLQTGVEVPITEPVAFTGTIGCATALSQPNVSERQLASGEDTWLIESSRDGESMLPAQMSDERLSGQLHEYRPIDTFRTPDAGSDAGRLQVAQPTWVIENDGGAWTATFPWFLQGDDLEGWRTPRSVITFEGSGDYAGMHALLAVDVQLAESGECDGMAVSGLVVSGGLPGASVS